MTTALQCLLMEQMVKEWNLHYDEHSRVPLIIKNAEWEDANFYN